MVSASFKLSSVAPTAHSLASRFSFSRFLRKKPRVLLIEDDADLSLLLKKTLEKNYSCRVDTATDPYEAMNCLTDRRYDLVVLDWQLPALTGGETLREVERGLSLEPNLPMQWDGDKIPVLIFSATPRLECTFRRSKHFNCVGYVSKRQSLKYICEAFNQHLQKLQGKLETLPA